MNTAHILNREASLGSDETEYYSLNVSWKIKDRFARVDKVRFFAWAEKFSKLKPRFRNKSFRPEKSFLVYNAAMSPTDCQVIDREHYVVRP